MKTYMPAQIAHIALLNTLYDDLELFKSCCNFLSVVACLTKCRLVWKPFQYLDESDVAGALAKAGQYEGGSVSAFLVMSLKSTKS